MLNDYMYLYTMYFEVNTRVYNVLLLPYLNTTNTYSLPIYVEITEAVLPPINACMS